MINIINEYGDDEWATPEKGNSMGNIKVGIDAFNDLAKSHDAHAKEVERLQKELKQTKNSLESGFKTKLELVKTNLRRYTFQSPKIKQWVEENSQGKVLNLFAGKTLLELDEVRNDLDIEANAESQMDAVDFVKNWRGHKFDTVILDPPYSYRKAMEMYEGNYSSRFKMLADELGKITHKDTKFISFGYHTTFMGNIRGYELTKLCIFAHGGAQHATIGIIEKKSK